MSGFFGFGQSGGEKASTSGLNSVFNYAMPQAARAQATGQGNLSSADQYFKRLLGGGRAQASANAAPVTNAVQGQQDTVARQEAAMGTGRGGGTAGANRDAATTSSKTIDDIINQNLVGGKQAAAVGESNLGNTQLSDASQLIGTAQKGQQTLYEGAINKESGQEGAFSRIIAGLL